MKKPGMIRVNQGEFQQKPCSLGFTLIELLIVVAIIAILAAIAVPNFMEAQVRSKVSRVKADQSALATALECYQVDNNRYPTMIDPLPEAESGFPYNASTLMNAKRGNWNADPVLFRLTSPVAYITSLSSSNDPFLDGRRIIIWGLPWSKLTTQMYMNYQEFMAATSGQSGANFKGWGLISLGPNGMPEGGNHIPRLAGMAAMGQWDQKDALKNAADRIYDPSNGTLSVGDVCRFGGAVPGGTLLK